MDSDNKFLSALIPNNYYFDQETFAKEQALIFQNNWYYVAITDSLAEYNDFVTAEIGGISVLIQNFKGELKAFHNVCTHRFNKIRLKREGNGPLACTYHAWNYNSDGIPFGIPLKKEFQGLDKDTLNQLCLKKFEVATCGKFVFVKIKEGGESLDHFLGSTKTWLMKISDMIGRKVEYHEIPNAANWKIVMENTLEGYHISSVHPNTFYKQGFNLKSAVKFENEGPHSNMILSLAETEQEDKKRAKFHKMLKDRPFQPEGFFHQIIFPNLSIGSLFGITVYIGSIRSIAPNQSVFAYELYETNLGDGKLLDEAVSEVVKYSSIEFTRTTLAEDREICENVQKGVEQTKAHKGVLNNAEIRIWDFQKAYLEKIK